MFINTKPEGIITIEIGYTLYILLIYERWYSFVDWRDKIDTYVKQDFKILHFHFLTKLFYTK